MVRLTLYLVGIVLTHHIAMAIPQFAALTGNRCSNCHINPGGGGVRNDLGWYSYNDISIVPREAGAVSWLYSGDSSNRFFDGTLTLGMDLRLMSARGFAAGSERRIFPMQATLYAAFIPVKAVTIEGSFNLAALRKAPNSNSRIVYAGQRMGAFSVLFQPDLTFPTIRAGLFRPSVGMRYDDHTMAPYSYTNGSTRLSYLAPDWSEYGAEVTYEGLRWLTVQAGAFGSEGLSQVQLNSGTSTVSAISSNSPTITARAVVWPRFLDDAINTWLGGSLLMNNSFSMTSAFASIGWSDHLSLMADYTITKKTGVTESRNFMTELSYQVFSPVILYTRYEHYYTKQASAPEAYEGNAGIFGAQVFVLPYVVVRPEYRIWDTQLSGTSNRWNIQLHIFY